MSHATVPLKQAKVQKIKYCDSMCNVYSVYAPNWQEFLGYTWPSILGETSSGHEFSSVQTEMLHKHRSVFTWEIQILNGF